MLDDAHLNVDEGLGRRLSAAPDTFIGDTPRVVYATLRGRRAMLVIATNGRK